MQSRSDWNAAPRQPGADFVPSQVLGVAVHWNGPRVGTGAARGDKAAVASYLRGVQRFHMVTRGWSDFAYNLAVDNTGRIWEGRGLTRRSGANGDADVNRKYVAILAVIGEGQRPTEAMLDGIREAIALVRKRYPNAKQIRGHQDVRPDPTACPGPDLERAVRSGRLDPSRTPTPAPPEEDIMASKDELRQIIREELRAVPDAVWNHTEPDPTPGRPPVRMGALMRYLDQGFNRVVEAARAAGAK